MIMAKASTPRRGAVRYADSLVTEDRGIVRLRDLRPSDEVVFHGHTLKVRDIPITYATLDCSHGSSGIALSEGDVVFCEVCAADKRVARTRQ